MTLNGTLDMSEKKYSHVFEVAFMVKDSSYSIWEDEVDKNPAKIIAALKARISYLESHPEEIREAVSGAATFPE